MNRVCRKLTAGFLVLAGAGFLTVSGAGTAHAQPSAPPAACTELLAAFKTGVATLEADVATIKTDPGKYKTAVTNFVSEIEKIGSTGSPALQSATKVFVADLEAGAASDDLDVAKFSADADRMDVAACTPKGAPATGGGSSAGLQDPALFGAGGAAALAGFVVVGLALRNRSRTSEDHG